MSKMIRGAGRWAASAGVLLTSMLALPQDSQAGRRPFIWTWDTEALSKGDLELEQWLWYKQRANPAGPITISPWLWVSPVYGLYDHVEIAFPWEAADTGTGMRLTDFAPELRVRLYDPNRDDRGVRVLVRAFGQANFNHPDNGGIGGARWNNKAPWAGGNVVASLGDPKNSHVAVDLGGFSDLVGYGCRFAYVTAAAGVTVRVSDDFRASAEYFGQNWRGNNVCANSYFGIRHETLHFAGPSIAFARGRVWATLGVMYGLNTVLPGETRIVMPRFLFATIL